MKRKIVALWAISCLAVSSAKAQFYTVSDNVCRYKVKKVEEKLLPPANNQVDSVTVNLLQQETDSVDNKQKQWISNYSSITYPLFLFVLHELLGYVVQRTEFHAFNRRMYFGIVGHDDERLRHAFFAHPAQ